LPNIKVPINRQLVRSGQGLTDSRHAYGRVIAGGPLIRVAVVQQVLICLPPLIAWRRGPCYFIPATLKGTPKRK